jgi:hypothetical protein
MFFYFSFLFCYVLCCRSRDVCVFWMFLVSSATVDNVYWTTKAKINIFRDIYLDRSSSLIYPFFFFLV